MEIENIVNAIRNSRLRITDHADEEAFDDNLAYEEIYFSVIHGKVIENYPNDKPYPSCLILLRNLNKFLLYITLERSAGVICWVEISQVSKFIAFGHIIRKTYGQH